MRKFLLIIAIILLVAGVKFIFDARPITKKMFSFGDQNDATLGLKSRKLNFELLRIFSMIFIGL